MPGEEVPMPEAFTRLQDIAMPRRHIEWGPDVEQFHQALEEECNTVAEKVHAIWRQFPSDLLQKIGNPMGRGRSQEPSFCVLNETKRLEATVDHFENRNLAATFRKVNVKYAHPEEWAITFDRLFPPPNYPMAPVLQQYKHMRYYLAWIELMSIVRRKEVVIIRAAVNEEFNKLVWAPGAGTDRVWKNIPTAGYHLWPMETLLPQRENAPRIIWNPGKRRAPEWVPPLIAALREEDEESEESEED
ncbi:hypothetical protein APHAL10511_003848 [Amanita phalloides]|nr:hypothetical protein APHAL10511_003848 [Amanita phalloides]